MKTGRMAILAPPEQKHTITRGTKILKLSTREVVRRVLESYRPGDDDALLNARLRNTRISLAACRSPFCSATRMPFS